MSRRGIQEHVRNLSSFLKSSEHDLEVGIRRCLQEKGIHLEAVSVAERFPDDAKFEFGIVVTASKRVYQYGYDYLHDKERGGTFTEWEDLTCTWEGSDFAENIKAALSNMEAGV